MRRREFLSLMGRALGVAANLNLMQCSLLGKCKRVPFVIDCEDEGEILLMGASSALRKAGEWLRDEVAERTGLRLPILALRGSVTGEHTQIIIGQDDQLLGGKSLCLRQYKRDGFRIFQDGRKLVIVGGNERSVFFGVGKFLLRGRFMKGRIEFPEGDILEKPLYSIRGHLLADRPNGTSYYWWDLPSWEKYVRYLLLWGVNTVGIVAGNFSSSATGGINPWSIPAGAPVDRIRVAKRYWSITAEVADLIHHYGLNVEGWVVANDVFASDYKRSLDMGGGTMVCPNIPEARELILKLHKEAYHSIPYLDILFIAGGDPGGCPCKMCSPWAKTFLPLAKDISQIYRESHPNGKVWLSPQFFDERESYDFFFEYMKTEKPNWVDAIIYGPNTHLTIEELRRKLDKRYPIVLYPDITHVSSCQYPIKKLDIRLKVIYSREPPNYRPHDIAAIHHETSPYSIGSSTYSEGVHDDLNKAVWSSLDWNPRTNAEDVVADYCRWFFGEANARRMARAIYGLERNWEIPILGNKNVEETLELLEEVAETDPSVKSNWRYQMALLRAMVDRYLQIKREHEVGVENHVIDMLTLDHKIETVKDAASFVKAELEKPLAVELRRSIDDLKVTLDSGTPVGNGLRLAFFWRLDVAIGNLRWLQDQLEVAAKIIDDSRRLDAINNIVHYEDPGPGGFYDEAGDPAREPHLVRGSAPEVLRDKPEWPDYMRFSQITMVVDPEVIVFRYPTVSPSRRYKVKVTYFTTSRYTGSVRLFVVGTRSGTEIMLHDSIPLPLNRAAQYSYEIPREAYATGSMELRFKKGETGNFAAVSEVWVMED